MSKDLDIICADIGSVSERFAAIARPGHAFAAEASFAMQALTASDYALRAAMGNRQSVVDAVTNIAAIGISLNPAEKQAYLVPRDGRICLDISYMGLMHLAMQSGSIKWAQCVVVHSGDQFVLHGIDKQPSHTFDPFAKERGDIVGVYCVVKTQDCDYLTHTMPIADVFAIRDKSKAWLKYVEKKMLGQCVWADHTGEMVKKTCVKQASKYWPRGAESGRLDRAIHHLNTAGDEGIEIEQPRKSGAIPATVGAMAAMSLDVQNYLRELAGDSQLVFQMDGADKALDKIVSEALDIDQTVALWSLLPSDMRAAIKKEKSARDEAAKVLA